MLRIVIDMQGAQTNASGHRGVGRYTKSLVRSLLSLNSKHQIILLFNGFYAESIINIQADFGDLLNVGNIRVWDQYLDFSGANRDSWPKMKIAELLREEYINSLNPDVVFSTNLQEGMLEPVVTNLKKYSGMYTTCTTLHDVVPLQKREYLRDPTVCEWYMEKIRAIECSDIVLTVSQSSKKEISEFTSLPEERVFVISNAVDHDKFKKIEFTDRGVSQRKRLSLPEKFILYVGGADKHKDLATLYKAYATLPDALKENFALVLVGSEIKENEADIRKTLESLGILDNFLLMGRLSDDDLVIALNLCNLFVFPSTHEGFGLPPLEAMACGAPVIVSSAPSLLEISACSEMVFNVGSSFDLCEKMQMILTDENIRKNISYLGLLRSKEFTWERSAIELLRIFDACPQINDNSSFSYTRPDDDELVNKVLGIVNVDLIDCDFTLGCIAKTIDKNFAPKSRPPTLFLDISAIVINGDRTGIQRVVRSIASHLLKMKSNSMKIELVYTWPNSSNFFRAIDVEKSWKLNNNYEYNDIVSNGGGGVELVTFHRDDVLVYLDLHPAVAISNVELNQTLMNNGIRVYHVLYDMLPIQLKNFFWRELTDEFLLWVNTICKSTGVLCISQSVSKSFKNWALENNKSKKIDVRWFHLGSDIEASIPSKGFLENSNFVLESISQKISLLMVGTLEPRKGHQQVLDALNILWADGYDLNLVIVGKEGWSVTELVESIKMHPEIDKRLYWLNRISDEYLHEIYIKSTCLIAASYGEGFGLPLVEAANNGIPIIARDIEIFREVAEENAFYFTADTGEALADSILKWVDLYKNNKQPDSSHLKRYTWSESAFEIFSLIQSK